MSHEEVVHIVRMLLLLRENPFEEPPRGRILVTGITTAVIMVVAAFSPHDAWRQPILRLVDTVVGVAVGVAASWIRLRVTWRATPLTRSGPGARREA